MKKVFFLLLLLDMTAINYAQNTNNGSLIYYITARDQGKLRKASNPATVIPICSTVKGMLKLGADGVASFDVFTYLNNDTATTNYNAGLAVGAEPCLSTATQLSGNAPYFIIDLPKRASLADPTPVRYIKYTAWNFGVSTIGLRFRGKDNNGKNAVGSGLSAAFNGGFTRGFAQVSPRKITHYYLNLGGFVGVGSTELNYATVTDNASWGTSAKQTNATVSYGPCLIIGRNNVGLVLTYGWENALGSDHQRWIFNDKPWFGIGLAASLGYF